MNYFFLLLSVTLTFTGCDDDAGGSADAGGDVDSGLGDVDSGPGDLDSGPGDLDSGPGEVDAGPAGDAGVRDAVDLRIRLHRLAGHGGRTVRLRAEDRSIVPLPPPVFFSADISAGGDAEILIPNGMPRDVFGVFVHFYVDVDGDETCTDPEPGWSAFVSNTFEDAEIVVDIEVEDPMSTVEPCAAVLTPS